MKTAKREKQVRTPTPSGKSQPSSGAAAPGFISSREKLFALLAGVWIGLTLVKLGNPVIFDRLVAPPQDLAEFIFTSWPIAWGYAICALVVLASFAVCQPRWSNDRWPIILLVGWLFWQSLSSARTVSQPLTSATLPHFVVCGISFLLGWWALARVRASGYFWTPVLLAFLYALLSGFDQQNGGLDATVKAIYELPDCQSYPP